jgi:hypothetical protein
MKKTFLFTIVMMTMSIICSCSQDSADNESRADVRRILSIDGSSLHSTYEYDKDGNLVKYINNDSSACRYSKVAYIYDLPNNHIFSTRTDSLCRDGKMRKVTYRDTLYLKDGVADSCSGVAIGQNGRITGYSSKYIYDRNEHLTTVIAANYYYQYNRKPWFVTRHSMTWKGSNLRTYMNDNTNKMFNDTVDYLYGNEPNMLPDQDYTALLLQHRPLCNAAFFGTVSKNMLTGFTHGRLTCNYECEKADDVITRITFRYNNSQLRDEQWMLTWQDGD